MLVPRTMPAELALFNARHGVPSLGCFALQPPPPGAVAAWALCLPWAMALLGPRLDQPLLVLPPTLGGFAWALAATGARVALAGEPPPGLARLELAVRGAVVPVGDPQDLPDGLFDAALRLAPQLAPPCAEEIELIARKLKPGGSLVLGFRVRDQECLDLGEHWTPTGGDPSVLPGTAGFAPRRYDHCLAHEAWRSEAGDAIGLLACQRAPGGRA